MIQAITKFLIISNILITVVAANNFSQHGKKPNIVIILADDLGFGDVSFLNPDSKIKTPNIDKLAKEGIWGKDVHSPSSICTPSRYSLLTGEYAWRNKRIRNGVLLPWGEPLITKKAFSLPKMLKENGYNTGCVGKWHLGFNWPWKGLQKPSPKLIGAVFSKATNEMFDWSKPITGGPLDIGFDYYFGDDVPNFPPYAFIENMALTCEPQNIIQSKLSSVGARGYIHGNGPGDENWSFENVLPTITDKALNFIDSQKATVPFFLMFNLTSPHTPVAPLKRFQGKSKAGSYGDFIIQTDYSIGLIIKKLKQNRLFKNSIVIVTSDNGPDYFHRNLIKSHRHSPSGKLRGMKWDAYEGGHRVPFIISWPNGNFKGGKSFDALVSLTDLSKTIAFLLKIRLGKKDAIDSIDVSKSILQNKEIRKEMVYHPGNGQLGLRSKNWVYLSSGGRKEPLWYLKNFKINSKAEKELLFNLEKDPYQRFNIAHKNPEILKSLKSRLKKIANFPYNNK